MLENNLEAFLARSRLINRAEKTLDLQYYYFNGDTSGNLITQLLVKAANRGVRIRLLLDDIDTLGADDPIRILNAHPDIEIRIFNPFRFRSLLRYLEFITDFSRVSRRMHNKSIIMDNCQAIIGGRNIGDIYFAADPELLFLDVDLFSLGPIVNQVSNSFDEYWNSQWAVPVDVLYDRPDRHYALNKIKFYLKKYILDVKYTDYVKAIQESPPEKISEHSLIWSSAQLFYDAPEKIEEESSEKINLLKNNLREIIDSSESELTLISPYFVPGEQGVRWFREIMAKGVKINVFTNSLAATDVIAVHAGYSEYRHELLAMGVKLYELKPSAYARERKRFKMLRAGSRTSLHAKIVIIDKKKVFIGSPNLDPRSNYLNTEMGLLVESEKLTSQVLDVFSGITEQYNSYHLKLEDGPDDHESNKNNRIVWLSNESGKQKQFYSDPEASIWRRIRVFVYSILSVEEML